MKLTKQKVRDLNHIGPKPKKIESLPVNCGHFRMKINAHGYYVCPDCKFEWDNREGIFG